MNILGGEGKMRNGLWGEEKEKEVIRDHEL